MLRFPNSYVRDPRAELIIEKNMNDLLIYIVEFVMDEFAVCREKVQGFTPAKAVIRHQSDFGVFLNSTYHITDSPVSSTEIYANLYSLLRSRQKFSPTPPMERLLALLIKSAILVNEDCYRYGYDGLYEIELEGDDRCCVLEALSRDRIDAGHHKPEGTKIAEFETPDHFLDMCFWNMDYLLPESAGRKSQKNKFLSKRMPAYLLPRKWWDDEDGPAEDYADYNEGGVSPEKFGSYFGY